MSVSCAHNTLKMDGNLKDVCFNLLFDARKTAIQKDEDKKIVELFQDYWCNDYDRIEEDIAELNSYRIKESD